MFQAEGTAIAEALRWQGACLCGNSKEASAAGVEREGAGASANRGSFRAVFLGTSLIYNLDLSPEWD